MGRRQGPEVQQVSGIQYMTFYGIKKVWDLSSIILELV